MTKEDMPEYSDLKLIDELLCLYVKRRGMTWADVERHTDLSSICMDRLRAVWRTDAMPTITTSLDTYFRLCQQKNKDKVFDRDVEYTRVKKDGGK